MLKLKSTSDVFNRQVRRKLVNINNFVDISDM